MQPAYNNLKNNKDDFLISERHAEEILSLPLWPEIEKDLIKTICKEL